MLIGIFGTGRNGSTLLGHLLDGLQDTYVHPIEENFLSASDDLLLRGRVTRLVGQHCTTRSLSNYGGAISPRLLEKCYRQSLTTLRSHFLETIGLPCNLTELELGDIVAEHPMTIEEFVPSFLKGIAVRVRPDIEFRHFLFKTIEVPYIVDYERRFPDMKFVHIVRDPVTTCSSQKRTLMEAKCLPASYLGYDWLTCMINKRWLPHAQFLASRRGDSRHILVRYEDLVVQPRAEISRIADGLGLAPPPRPTTQTIFYDLDKTKWGSNPSMKGVDSVIEAVPDLQERNRYDEVLTKREIDLIAVKTRDFLLGLGYQSPSDATLGKVVAQYLTLDKWELMHCNTPHYLVRGLIGLLYRRATLF